MLVPSEQAKSHIAERAGGIGQFLLFSTESTLGFTCAGCHVDCILRPPLLIASHFDVHHRDMFRASWLSKCMGVFVAVMITILKGTCITPQRLPLQLHAHQRELVLKKQC